MSVRNEGRRRSSYGLEIRIGLEAVNTCSLAANLRKTLQQTLNKTLTHTQWKEQKAVHRSGYPNTSLENNYKTNNNIIGIMKIFSSKE